jgi:ribulose-5-phosphate 4-epimerase/fuculose-1-phosphate aldolase
MKINKKFKDERKEVARFMRRLYRRGLTTGTTLLQAFDKLEVLENAAKMTLLAELTGRKKVLGNARISQTVKLFR